MIEFYCKPVNQPTNTAVLQKKMKENCHISREKFLFFQGKLLLAFSAFGGYKLLRTYHRRIFPQDYNVAPTYIMLNHNDAILQDLVR